MIFKTHKNITWSLVLYIIGIAAYFCLLYIPGISPNVVYTPALIVLFVGIFFGFRSIKARESSWAGHMIVVIGGLIIIAPFLIFVLAANGIL